MSVSDSCGCRIRWIVEHYHWILPDKDAKECWPERLPSDYSDQEESPWTVNSHDENCGYYSDYSVWRGGWIDGWNGRRGGRLDRQQIGWRGGGLVGGWVCRWDETPSTSFHRTREPSRILVYFEKCCKLHIVPDGAEDWYTASIQAYHHYHRDNIINGSSDSDSMSFGGRQIDWGRMGDPHDAWSCSHLPPRIVFGAKLL